MTVIDAQVDRITAQARQVHAGRALLAFVAVLLMWVGRVPAYAVTAVVWSAVAMREGYRDVRPPVRRSGGAG